MRVVQLHNLTRRSIGVELQSARDATRALSVAPMSMTLQELSEYESGWLDTVLKRGGDMVAERVHAGELAVTDVTVEA